MRFGRRHAHDHDPDALRSSETVAVRDAQYAAAYAYAHAEALAAVAEAMANTMARNGGNNPLVREARRILASWRAFQSTTQEPASDPSPARQ